MSNKCRAHCCVITCTNKKSNCCDLSFFTLPKDVERRNEWLRLMGREDLLKRADLKPYNYEVCSAHFETSMFNEHRIRKLLPHAVPKFITPEEVAEYASRNKAKSLDASIQTEDSYVTLLAAAKAATGLADDEDGRPPGTDEITERFYKLLQWQSNKRNKFNGKYDPEFKQLALNIRISCPKTYQALQSVLNLPNENTLARFNLNIRPEIEEGNLNAIQLKLKTLPNVAKYCTICLGQIALKRHAFYNITRDEIIGFQNVNGYVRDELASTAYVIMLRGIAVDWTQPVAYALLVDEDQLQELDYLITEVITNLARLDIKVMAIVSKHGSHFEKYAKEIKQVSAENPYITFNDTKVYYIFDVPHMLTSLRDNLLTNDLIYEGNNIAWSHIKEMYSHQKENNLHLMPKITDDHINLDKNQKTIVKYAAQIFSRSVYGALNTFIHMNLLPKEAKSTAEFVILINNLFDVLNSSAVVTENKYQRALTGDKDQIAVFDSAHKMFEQMTAASHKTGNRNKLAIFENFRITMAATTILCRDLKEEGISFMLTERLNQDPLESFFDSVKEQESWRKPSSIQIKRAFSKCFLQNILKSSYSTDNQEGLLSLLSKDNIETTLISQEQYSEVLLGPDGGKVDYNFKVPAQDGITYVATYLLMKCSKNHQCVRLGEYLKHALNLQNTFPIFEGKEESPFNNVPKLLSRSFLNYVSALESTFVEHFEELNLTRQSASSILTKLREVFFPAPCQCFPTYYLLRLFVRFRVYNLLQYNNRIYKKQLKRSKYNLQVNSIL